ncbi:hypothetical protein cce_3084 [Crocosphaera subtropica ATCC 51142]|uniref:Uncharacterized protein n=1 Tax=Crocosphaera subtropica (strain ATCC 51142 / BH68) TaxID=43989 RepID=B1WWW3_CROS5|nr:hypothetical protein cce_3084 [Crocosphaera subtropica ATCC 51142]
MTLHGSRKHREKGFKPLYSNFNTLFKCTTA